MSKCLSDFSFIFFFRKEPRQQYICCINMVSFFLILETLDVIISCLPGGSIGTGKAFMRMSGIDLGPPRLPLFPLSAEKYKALQSDLVAIGFFDWA